MELVRIDLATHRMVEDQAPFAHVIAGILPPETWPDLTDRGYPGVGYWPVVQVQPEYEPATHTLGAESLNVDMAGLRVVRTWAVVAKPRVVPQRVSMRSGRRVMILAGLLEPVKLFLVNMAGIAGELARNEFEYALTIARTDPLVLQILPMLGKSEAQIDQLFIDADELDKTT